MILAVVSQNDCCWTHSGGGRLCPRGIITSVTTLEHHKNRFHFTVDYHDTVKCVDEEKHYSDLKGKPKMTSLILDQVDRNFQYSKHSNTTLKKLKYL